MCPTGYLRSFGIIILFVTPGNSEYQKCKHLEKHSTEDMGIRRHQLSRKLILQKKKETSQNVTTIKEIIAALGHHKTLYMYFTELHRIQILKYCGKNKKVQEGKFKRLPCLNTQTNSRSEQ